MLNSSQSSVSNLEPYKIQFGHDALPVEFMRVKGMDNDQVFAALESMAKATGEDVFTLIQAKQDEARIALKNMPSKLH